METEKKRKIGLALSGGGYRAAAYHIGTLKKLHEMNILKNVDIISSISGGSITSAFYGLYGENFQDFENGLIKGVKSNVIKGILLSTRFLIISSLFLSLIVIAVFLLFTTYAWISSILVITGLVFLYKYQFNILPLSKIIEDIYNRYFFSNKTLSEFSGNTLIAINSTNMETGRLFTFSKNKMNDSSYEYPNDKGNSITFKNEIFPIARAVAASTCVPFAFTPIKIDKKYFVDESDTLRVKPCLVDGGVYDNQGIHKITQKGSSYECDIIITSDAGNMLPYENNYRNTIELLIRTSEIFMNRIKNFQLIKNIYENPNSHQKEIAYLSLGWDIENSIPEFISNLKKGNIADSVIEAHDITKTEIEKNEWEKIEEKIKTNVDYERIVSESPTPEQLKIARSVKTSLKTLKDSEINALIKHSYCMTELQVRLYCPSLINI
jgi:NTE family protein